MPSIRFLPAFAWATAFAALAPATLADGGFFSRDPVPPDLPAQQAFLAFDGREEVLLIQPKFEASVDEFGWIVPLPAVPEVDGLENREADDLFAQLYHASRPTRIGKGLPAGAALLLLSAALLGRRIVRRARAKGRASAPRAADSERILIFVLATLGVVLPVSDAQLLGSRRPAEVLLDAQVGAYEVKVVRGEEGKTVLDWLEDNGFAFHPGQEAVLDVYSRGGWCFAAAKIRTGASPSVSSKGLLEPLVFRFPAKEAVYPLALTGSYGKPLDLTLYVLAEHRMDDGGRIGLRFAGPYGPPYVEDGGPGHATTYYPGYARKGLWLTKFRGTLPPQRMAADLALAPAGRDREFRPFEIR
ncbi:MAG: DUF2330 domain-containing protein [Planctomycetes bacterium]|nr:DUF2330 domain-containing protein [Planctomycetota bacterium]